MYSIFHHATQQVNIFISRQGKNYCLIHFHRNTGNIMNSHQVRPHKLVWSTMWWGWELNGAAVQLYKVQKKKTWKVFKSAVLSYKIFFSELGCIYIYYSSVCCRSVDMMWSAKWLILCTCRRNEWMVWLSSATCILI